MHEVLVNRLGGLSLPRKSVVRLTDRPDMTLDVYRGRKTTMQQQQQQQQEKASHVHINDHALYGNALIVSRFSREMVRFKCEYIFQNIVLSQVLELLDFM